jgi:hypothetical protein
MPLLMLAIKINQLHGSSEATTWILMDTDTVLWMVMGKLGMILWRGHQIIPEDHMQLRSVWQILLFKVSDSYRVKCGELQVIVFFVVYDPVTNNSRTMSIIHSKSTYFDSIYVNSSTSNSNPARKFHSLYLLTMLTGSRKYWRSRHFLLLEFDVLKLDCG